MPISATCTRGSELTRRPLPSFVTRQTEPVDADAEVGAGDADVGVEEDLPQLAARRLRERLELRWYGHALDGREQRGRVLGRLLDRRREDVHRVLAGELDDVLAEIGFDDADAGRLQRVVQADLLRQPSTSTSPRAWRRRDGRRR